MFDVRLKLSTSSTASPADGSGTGAASKRHSRRSSRLTRKSIGGQPIRGARRLRLGGMVGRDQRLMVIFAGAACLATLLGALAGLTEVLAYAAPLLVLLLPLLAGRFVGEERIARAAARIRRAPPAAPRRGGRAGHLASRG